VSIIARPETDAADNVAALLGGLAFMAFSGIAFQELGYANAHPHRYGPVKAVGLAAVAGMLLAAALEALAFALGAGRVLRRLLTRTASDFFFAQMSEPELAPEGWRRRFIDYLYVSLTNATAFSPPPTPCPSPRPPRLLEGVSIPGGRVVEAGVELWGRVT